MIDGQPVESGSFPWTAVLFIKKEYYNSEPRHVCVASLVSSWNVITAAHCLDEPHFRKYIIIQSNICFSLFPFFLNENLGNGI